MHGFAFGTSLSKPMRDMVAALLPGDGNVFEHEAWASQAVVDAVEGVPLMTPDEPSVSPEGSAGDTLQKALSPVFDGVMLEIAVPTVNVNGEPV